MGVPRKKKAKFKEMTGVRGERKGRERGFRRVERVSERATCLESNEGGSSEDDESGESEGTWI